MVIMIRRAFFSALASLGVGCLPGQTVVTVEPKKRSAVIDLGVGERFIMTPKHEIYFAWVDDALKTSPPEIRDWLETVFTLRSGWASNWRKYKNDVSSETPVDADCTDFII